MSWVQFLQGVKKGKNYYFAKKGRRASSEPLKIILDKYPLLYTYVIYFNPLIGPNLKQKHILIVKIERVAIKSRIIIIIIINNNSIFKKEY